MAARETTGDNYAKDETERDPAQEGFARRGRPRPQDTIDRDEQVYQLLRTGGATTKSDLAVQLQQPENSVYHSLTRLRDTGKVRRAPGQRDGRQSNTWEAVTE